MEKNVYRGACIHTTKPETILVPGGKIIRKYVGRAHSGIRAGSVTKMVAPLRRDEPVQHRHLMKKLFTGLPFRTRL